MKICAIDSSGLVASVALLQEDITVAEYSIQHKITHSQTLLPMLDEICSRIGTEISDIDAFAVTAGPGSFTGLRIGMATVKGLGIVVDKPVACIPTLEVLAYNLYGTRNLVCPIMDARRHQVYTGIYEFSEKKGAFSLVPVCTQAAMDFGELAARLNELGREVIFTGDGVPVYAEDMKNMLSIPYSVAPAHLNRQRAGTLAALASEYLAGDASQLEGTVCSVDSAEPIYLRLSQAEREKKERSLES